MIQTVTTTIPTYWVGISSHTALIINKIRLINSSFLCHGVPHYVHIQQSGPYEPNSNLLSWRESLAEVVEIGVDDEGPLNMHFLDHEFMMSR